MQVRDTKNYDQAQFNLKDWFSHPLGTDTFQTEHQTVSEHLKPCFGIYRVHIGPGAYIAVKESANIPRTILLGTYTYASAGIQVIMAPWLMTQCKQ